MVMQFAVYNFPRGVFHFQTPRARGGVRHVPPAPRLRHSALVRPALRLLRRHPAHQGAPPKDEQPEGVRARLPTHGPQRQGEREIRLRINHFIVG